MLVAVLLAAAIATALAYRIARHPTTDTSSRGARTAFVDDRGCHACHEAESRAWSGSHHAKAMERADASSVLGTFDGRRLVDAGVTWRFFRKDGRFFVNAQGPDGRATDFEITYTFGLAPLQQYLVAFPGGRLQALTVAWDTARKRWFSLYPGLAIAPGSPLHWTGRYQNWNLMCAECHTTNLRKGYDPVSDSYATTWSALHVGCQACHGPGEEHLVWARTHARAETARDMGLSIDLDRGPSSAEVDLCARCHSRRVRLVEREHPGRPFLDELKPEVLRADLYYPDGQQRGEVYEYGSFRQSTMYQRGVRCTDCHDPHGGTLTAAGDALCTRCHGPRPDPRFPTLTAKTYDSPAHHFHRPASAGARCVACHMPARTYMRVDPRRDHGLRVPRPDLSVKLGTPNACTACHADRSARWAAAAAETWWGPRLRRRPDDAEVIAAARAGARDAEPALVAIVRDHRRPAIVRATALDLLRRYGVAGAAAATGATKDEDPVVRAAAIEALGRLPARERLAAVAPALADPIRAVRIEAARVLASVPPSDFTAPQRAAFETALAELESALLAMADMPSARLSLGALYENLGRRDAAEQAYRAVLRMDPDLFAACVGLARLYDAIDRGADAERVLREGIARTPRQGELHYALGLLLARRDRLGEAAEALRDATRFLPDRARVRYNYGAVLQRLGRSAEAEGALRRALELDGNDPDVAYALAVLSLGQRRYERALTYARLLSRIAPRDPRASGLVAQIERARGGIERK